jgi:hypothetical protein
VTPIYDLRGASIACAVRKSARSSDDLVEASEPVVQIGTRFIGRNRPHRRRSEVGLLGGYCSHFHHETEVAQAGYYAVTLDDYQIRAEAAAAPHTGILRFTLGRAASLKTIAI